MKGADVFVGRRELTSAVQARLSDEESAVISLLGPPGVGKTAFLRNLIRLLEEQNESPVVSYFLRRDSAHSSPIDCLRTLVYALRRKHGQRLTQVPPSLSELAAIFEGELTRISLEEDRKTPEVVVIDALDEAEDPLALIRALPKELPEGVFLVVSSRPTSDSQVLLGGVPAESHFELNPLSDENLSDGEEFLQQQLSGWPRAACKRFARRLGGSFLVLRLLVDLALRRGASPEDLEDLVGGLGAVEELDGVYRKFWRLLREDIDRKRPEELPQVYDLAGVLSVCLAPVSRQMVAGILGWSGTELERVVLHLEPYLVIESEVESVNSEREELLSIYHDTFRAFVRRRLSPDVGENHRLVVDWLRQSVNSLDERKCVDRYRLRHLIPHAALSDHQDLVLSLVDRGYVEARLGRPSHASHLLNDLLKALEVAEDKAEIGAMLFLVFARTRALESAQGDLLLPEELLRTRLGEGRRESLENSHFLHPSGALTLLVEALATSPEEDREFRHRLRGRIEEVAPNATHESVLRASLRIVVQAPALAVDLLDGCCEERDDPWKVLCDRSRAVGLQAKEAERTGGDEAVAALINALESPLEKAVAAAAAGASVVCEEPERGARWLTSVAEGWEGEGRDSVAVVLRDYLLRQLDGRSVETTLALLGLCEALSPSGVWDEDLAIHLDRHVTAERGAWQEVLGSSVRETVPDEVWPRLDRLGVSSPPRPQAGDEGGVNSPKRHNGGHQSLLSSLPFKDDGRLADDPALQLRIAARTISGLSESLETQVPELALAAMQIAVSNQDWPLIDAVCDLVLAAMPYPGLTRGKVIELALTVGQPGLGARNARRRLAVAATLARGWESSGSSLRGLLELVEEQGSGEMQARVLLSVLREVSTVTAATIAQEPGEWISTLADNQQGGGEIVALGRVHRVLALCELALLLNKVSRQGAEEALRRAADLCRSIETKEEREQQAAQHLVEAALSLDPGFVWEVVQRAGIPTFWVDVLGLELLSQGLQEVEERRFEILRVGLIFAYLSPRASSPQDRASLTNTYSLLQGRSSSCLVRDRVALGTEWTEQMEAFVSGYSSVLDEGEDIRASGLDSIMVVLARRNWEVLQRTARKSELRSAFSNFPLWRLGESLAFPLSGSPEQQLSDVRYLRNLAVERRSKRWKELLAEMVAATLAGAAAVDSKLLVRFITALPERWEFVYRCFPHALRSHTAACAWDLDDIRAVIDAIMPKLGPWGLYYMVILGRWLGANLPDWEEFIRATLKAAEDMAESYHLLIGLAGVAGAGFEDEVRRLRAKALSRMIQAGDTATIVANLEIVPEDAEVAGEVGRYLGRALKRGEIDQEGALKVGKWSAGRDASLALQCLELQEVKFEDSDVMADLKAVVIRLSERIDASHAEDVEGWFELLEALPNLPEEIRELGRVTLIEKAVREGRGWKPHVALLSRPGSRARALLAACDSELPQGEFGSCEALQRLVAEAPGASYEVSSAGEKLAELLIAEGQPARAESVLRSLLRGLRGERLAPMHWRLGTLLELAEGLPEAPYERLLGEEWEAFSALEYSSMKEAREGQREEALGTIAAAAWPVNKNGCRRWIETVQSSCPGGEADTHIVKALSIRVARLSADGNQEEALKLTRFILRSFSEVQSPKVADAILEWMIIRDPADSPLRRYGLRGPGLVRASDRGIVKVLLPGLSHEGRGRAHIALALAAWETSRSEAKRDLEAAARHCSAIQGGGRGHSDEPLLVAHALSSGVRGVAAAIRATGLSEHVAGEDIGKAMVIAIEASQAPRELLEDYWASCTDMGLLGEYGG